MKALLAMIALGWAWVCSAAIPMAPTRHSQQLTVIDARPPLVPATPLHGASGEGLIHLDADVLLLSASRIREALFYVLSLPDKGGRIRLVLYRATKPDDLITVVSSFTPAGWEYEADVPDQLDAVKLTRGVVNVLLLEFANRGEGRKQGELPLWLVEGMTQDLLSVAGKDIALTTVPTGSMLRVIRDRKGLDYLQNVREVLGRKGALTFSELAYPQAQHLAGDRLPVYEACAQLFVYELLHMSNGVANFTAMLRQLPLCWNWETALIRAYTPQFQRMLDVEKKWSVDVLALTARDPAQVLGKMRALDQLSTVLSVPARVPVAPNQIPERRTLTLSEVLTTWDIAAQRAVLRQRLIQLQSLRFTAPKEVVPVIDSYSRAISNYLLKLDQAGRDPANRMQGTVSASLAAQDAIRTLKQLDNQREALRPAVVNSGNSPTTR